MCQPVRLADHPGIVGAEDRASGSAALAGPQERSGQANEVVVHFRLPAEGDLRRLPVRSLDQSDRGMKRQERLQIVRRPVEIGLQAEAHVLVVLPQAPEELQGEVDVVGRLHVDPHEPASVARPCEAVQSVTGPVRGQIQAELRELHRDLSVDPRRRHRVHRPEVVLRHRVGLGVGGDVLPEDRERRGDPLGPQPPRLAHRLFQSLTRKEPPGRLPDEAVPGKALGQEWIRGRPQQRVSQHGDSRHWRTKRYMSLMRRYAWSASSAR